MTLAKIIPAAALLCGCASLPAPSATGAMERLKTLYAAAETCAAAGKSFAGPAELAACSGSRAETADPWGTPSRMEALPEYRARLEGTAYRFFSAGPDRAFGTADDLVWPPAFNAPPEEKE